MAKVKAKIRGIKPLIFHKFNIEVLTMERKPKEGTTGNNPEEWKTSFFHENNNLYIPDTYMFASLKNGSVNTKLGRGTIQKTWISGVIVETDKIFLNRKIWDNWENTEINSVPTDTNCEVFVNVCMVSNPNTKGKNIRYRLAVSKGWECEFTLDVDEILLSSSQVKKVIEDTGKLQGIADGRTLGYGRFELLEYEFLKK